MIDALEFHALAGEDLLTSVRAHLATNPPRMPQGKAQPEWTLTTVTKVSPPFQAVKVTAEMEDLPFSQCAQNTAAYMVGALYLADPDRLVQRLLFGFVPKQSGQPTKAERDWALRELEAVAENLRPSSLKIVRAAGTRRLEASPKLAIEVTVPEDWVSFHWEGESASGFGVEKLNKLGEPMSGSLDVYVHGCGMADFEGPAKGPFVKGKLLGRDVQWSKTKSSSGRPQLKHTLRSRGLDDGQLIDVECYFWTASAADEAEVEKVREIAATTRVVTEHGI